MAVLWNLEPQKVFSFFEEICGIPHGSGNVEQISDYLVEFAKKRALFCVQDKWKNVIIKKEGSTGYEEMEPVILQAHMDMVCVREKDCDLDMQREGLRLATDGTYVYAQGTSLGGDDGIGVAYALALLDDEGLQHPPLEVILTVDEETGMEGAKEVELSMLSGRRMINLDSEEEGIFLVSCAGGSKVNISLPMKREECVSKERCCLRLFVDGLQGGHSGVEINQGRGNANLLMVRVLSKLLQRHASVQLVSFAGGCADNAIPSSAQMVIEVNKWELEALCDTMEWVAKESSAELSGREPNLRIHYAVMKQEEVGVLEAPFDQQDTQRMCDYFMTLPNGVMEMSAEIPGLVETSLNLGIVETRDHEVLSVISVRSNIDSAKEMLCDRLDALARLAGGSLTITGDYPGWPYQKDSRLREQMIRVYEEMYGKSPKVEALHAGLECGILAAKLPGLDCVSMGPNILDIHTAKERLEIASTKRVWEFLVRFLQIKQ